MNAQERRADIVRQARLSGLASVEELSDRYGVTASTIRRDLAKLASSEELVRTYGGAMVPPRQESSVAVREGVARDHKAAIGRWCAGQVFSGQNILLDSGTTVAQLARYLRDTDDLNIVTTGLTSLRALAGVPEKSVTCLGGTYRDVSDGFVGPVTERALEHFTFDSVFLGADAVHAEHGICEASQEQVRLKELMARAGDRVYVLVHSDKLGQTPFRTWARIGSGWTLVTDSGAKQSQLAPFDELGIHTVQAPEQ